MKAALDRPRPKMIGGYVYRVKCQIEHAGTRRFFSLRDGRYQCLGCGAIRDAEWLVEEQLRNTAE